MLVRKFLPAIVWEALWEFALWLAWGDPETAEDIVTWLFFGVFLLGLLALARAAYRFAWGGLSLLRQDDPRPFQGMQELRDLEAKRKREADEADRMERHTRALNENTKALREKGDPPK